MSASARSALLAGILAAPEDDAPPLVFADWLEEHGNATDQARAEFIRIQIDLDRLGNFGPGRRALWGRQQELLEKHRATWLKEVPVWARREAEFRRGFVHHIGCTAHTFLTRVGGLFRRAPIRSLSLREAAAHIEALADCEQLVHLRELQLPPTFAILGPEHVRRLARSPHLSNLTALDLNAHFLGPGGAATLAAAPALANLITLHLGSNHIGNHGLAALARSRALKGLRRLSLYHNDLTVDAVPVLCSAPWRPTFLNLGGNRLGNAFAEALRTTPRFADLEDLALYGTRLTPRGVEAIARSSHLTRLTTLHLGDLLGDEGAAWLARAPHLASLERLFLRDAGIGDTGALALAESPHLKGLRVLALEGNEIGAQARKRLQARFGEAVLLD